MVPRDHKQGNASETALSIRRQIGYAENMRFLRRLPGFELERELPTQFLELLGKLRRAEDAPKDQRGRGSGAGTQSQ